MTDQKTPAEHAQAILQRYRESKDRYHISPEAIRKGHQLALENLIQAGVSPATAQKYLNLKRCKKHASKDRRYKVAEKLTEETVKNWHAQFISGKTYAWIAKNATIEVSETTIRKAFQQYGLTATGRRGTFTDEQYKSWFDYYQTHNVTIAWIARNMAEDLITTSTIRTKWRKLGLTNRVADDGSTEYICPKCGVAYAKFQSLAGHTNTHKKKERSLQN